MALFEFTEWDGSQQAGMSAAEAAFERIAEYLMQYGDRVLRDLDDMDNPDAEDLLEKIQQQGLLEKDAEGNFRVSPKGLRQIQESALGELFQTFARDGIGKHDTAQKGAGTVRHEDTKPYVYGDSLANLNLHETLKNTVVRQGGKLPLKPSYDDFVVYETEYQSNCATVVLIDMSGSMTRYGKYATTKKVGLALQAMVRARYPQDTLRFVGFYSFANVMTERQLLESAPKQVSLFDSRVFMRVSLDDPPKRAPQHFTNIHAGLRLARSLLMKSGAANKQIIVVTDGEPTAHIEGREVLLIYPPSERTAEATLAEARRCSAAGIRVSSFALVEDYYYFGLVNFVEDMARVTKGVAAYCSAEEIGKYVFDSFVNGRRTRKMSG